MLNKSIGILGGGSWATAIVKIITDSGTAENINWFIRNSENIEFIKTRRRNKYYLRALELQIEKLSLSDDINKVIQNSDLLIFAIPSAFIKNALAKNNFSLNDKYIISAVKGIIPDDNLIFAEYFNQTYNVPVQNIGIIAGPCHAEEIAGERLSYLTVASKNRNFAELIGNKIKTRYTRINISDDIYGTEYSTVLKNIFAIASGICIGLGYGDNFQAVLVSNAIREIKRFVDAVHPITRDIKNSAYLGDLLVTAYSKFSRNRIFGTMIGRGYSVKAAQSEMKMIAEGYYAVKSIFEINKKHKISLPITDAVYNILYENKPATEEIKNLTDKLT
ncbi:MAG: NAD(P)H-dependent glycerol-3-phosphate dehydrogenase [Chlorobi bacterium]|nr:NAD(P)H-dependent glycerol-3-phosphate dehydrogenase [Chlorobiota bacterium]